MPTELNDKKTHGFTPDTPFLSKLREKGDIPQDTESCILWVLQDIRRELKLLNKQMATLNDTVKSTKFLAVGGGNDAG